MTIENFDEEYKERWHNGCLETVAAFHNTAGGTMHIGRRDNGDFVDLRGCKELTESITGTINNKLRIFVDARMRPRRTASNTSPSSCPKTKTIPKYSSTEAVHAQR